MSLVKPRQVPTALGPKYALFDSTQSTMNWGLIHGVALHLVEQNVSRHLLGHGPRGGLAAPEKPLVNHGIGQCHRRDPGDVGAVFPLAYVPDIGQHPLVILHDLALIHSQYLFNEGRSRPATVQHGLLVHE